jgi:hypothetical protein
MFGCMCVHDVFVHDVFVHDVFVHDVFVHDVFVHDVFVHDVFVHKWHTCTVGLNRAVLMLYKYLCTLKCVVADTQVKQGVTTISSYTLPQYIYIFGNKLSIILRDIITDVIPLTRRSIICYTRYGTSCF